MHYDAPFVEKDYSGRSIHFAVPTRGVGSKNNGAVPRTICVIALRYLMIYWQPQSLVISDER
jgi:hypothetical protein